MNEDALSEILRSVRLRGSVLSRASLRAPWSVRSEGMRDGSAVYHCFVEGGGWLAHASRPAPYRIAPGDLVMITRGDAHVISSDPALAPLPIEELYAPVAPDTLPLVDHGPAGGAGTRILCGSFSVDHAGARSFFEGLPRVMHASVGGVAGWSDQTVRMVEDESLRGLPAANALLARVAEVLFVQILRACAATLAAERSGWLAALHDGAIARSLALIHTSPAEAWTAETLARKVALSRTAFFERFSKLVGEPPAQYLGRWRALTAADLLRRSDLGTAEIASRVGYGSEDAFAKAFKRHLGQTPAAYRRAATAA